MLAAGLSWICWIFSAWNGFKLLSTRTTRSGRIKRAFKEQTLVQIKLLRLARPNRGAVRVGRTAFEDCQRNQFYAKQKFETVAARSNNKSKFVQWSSDRTGSQLNCAPLSSSFWPYFSVSFTWRFVVTMTRTWTMTRTRTRNRTMAAGNAIKSWRRLSRVSFACKYKIYTLSHCVLSGLSKRSPEAAGFPSKRKYFQMRAYARFQLKLK